MHSTHLAQQNCVCKQSVFHTARLDSAPKASQHLSLFHLQTIELSDLLSDVNWHVTHSKDDGHPHRTGSRLMPSVAPVCIQEVMQRRTTCVAHKPAAYPRPVQQKSPRALLPLTQKSPQALLPLMLPLLLRLLPLVRPAT